MSNKRPTDKTHSSLPSDISPLNHPERIVTLREWCSYWQINQPLALSWLEAGQLQGAYRSPDVRNGTWLMALNLRPLEIARPKLHDLEIAVEETTVYLIALDESVTNLGVYQKTYEARKACTARAQQELKWKKQEDETWEAVSDGVRYRLVRSDGS